MREPVSPASRMLVCVDSGPGRFVGRHMPSSEDAAISSEGPRAAMGSQACLLGGFACHLIHSMNSALHFLPDHFVDQLLPLHGALAFKGFRHDSDRHVRAVGIAIGRDDLELHLIEPHVRMRRAIGPAS